MSNALGKTPLLQGIFYVFHKGNVCSSVRNYTFLPWKTYGSGSGNEKIKPVFPGKQDFVFLIPFPTLKCRFFSVSLKTRFT
jgi:hypothetical protein